MASFGSAATSWPVGRSAADRVKSVAAVCSLWFPQERRRRDDNTTSRVGMSRRATRSYRHWRSPRDRVRRGYRLTDPHLEQVTIVILVSMDADRPRRNRPARGAFELLLFSKSRSAPSATSASMIPGMAARPPVENFCARQSVEQFFEVAPQSRTGRRNLATRARRPFDKYYLELPLVLDEGLRFPALTRKSAAGRCRCSRSR